MNDEHRLFTIRGDWEGAFGRQSLDRGKERLLTLYLGGASEQADSVVALPELTVRIRLDPTELSHTAMLFLLGPEISCECDATSLPEPSDRIRGRYGELLACLEHVHSASACASPFHDACVSAAVRHGLTQLMPIGAVLCEQREFAGPGGSGMVCCDVRLYVCATLDRDTVFSFTAIGQPLLTVSRVALTGFVGEGFRQEFALGDCELQPVASPAEVHLPTILGSARHGFIEPELDERAYNDLSIMEREIKFDASSDPRPATWAIRPGNGYDIFNGHSILNVHYHRVYNIGPTGIIYMASDTSGTDGMLKYKHTLRSDSDVFLRFEIVEPNSAENLERIAEMLEPGVDVGAAILTPFFFRDRVKCNVYLAESRNIFEVFGDHSTFMEGSYRPFDQVEIEYIGVIQDLAVPVRLGIEFEDRVNDDFARVEAAVRREYAKAGVSLTVTTRSKFDWANAEIFTRRAPDR